jgi:hypothetical protein
LSYGLFVATHRRNFRKQKAHIPAAEVIVKKAIKNLMFGQKVESLHQQLRLKEKLNAIKTSNWISKARRKISI